MLFSVIIPVYNVEKYLSECLESIIPQTQDRNDIEILLIDDGSKDKSLEICKDYNKLYPNLIKVYHKENEGLFLTRRYGFKHAKGKYIINCDSDDTLSDEFFTKIDNIINQDSPDVLIYNLNIWSEDNKYPIIRMFLALIASIW